MTKILDELVKVKSELTLEEIDSALEFLLKEKEQLYKNNVKEKKSEIAKFEDEASLVKIKIGDKIGKIKIQGVDYPDYKLVKNIPIQSHFYVARKNQYWCCLTNSCKELSFWSQNNTNIHPAITYENKSDFELKIGEKFFINDEEFLVIGENVAFKVEKLDETYNTFNLAYLEINVLNWWFNSLLNEARRRSKIDGEK